MDRFSSGDHIVLRETWHRRIWTARPAIVVEDSDEVIALFLANGSRWKRAFDVNGSKKRIPVGDWSLGDDVWDNDVLRISVPGERFSVLPINDREGRLRFWYINIETPLQRTRLGFDYMDQTLDIIVDPDLYQWRWKDEAELAEAVAADVYTEVQAEQILTAGEAALEWFLSRNPPLDRDWERWRPDPRWEAPQLAGSWETVAQT